ncbi:DNA (cytosine-5-)-methyltransferase [Arsenicibacter rosenii]|uniref:Cytosine-specific methyltransferase n=1 Tax=Arsenicibacter rosenii TaxID=1750698 RepID=A0A1S2VAL7_9BACT|nr:DNA (cytosine-5-)-methyltransferase [Arsenicibacter rosenii]OIN55774.1 DNA (cytosine-5-)-methyltransferase [Arsenicibacter rosenii]
MQTGFLTLREQSGLTPQEVADRCAVSLRTVYRWEKGECKPNTLAVRELQKIVKAANTNRMSNSPQFKFIDLFAGIGGFRKAFESIGGRCVFTSEWDKACRTTYQANYGCDHPVEGDIREFTKDPESLDKIPAHDVLIGGFPCQPFSIAGVSKKNALGRLHGFRCETQGTLFFDLAQIIEHHRPPAILLENVKNLVSHDGGKTFRIIRQTLEEELGYTIDYRIIDGKNWVPQHRERIFIVGFRNDVGFDFRKLELPDFSARPKLESILHRTDGSELDEPPYFVNGEVAEKYTLTPRLWQYLQDYKEKHSKAGNGFGFGLFGPEDVSRTLSARYYKDGSEILIRQEGKRPRRLTPRECARLMGFDLPSESSFQIPVSDTQAYRQFGNSVVVQAAQAVARHMKPHIMEAIARRDNQLSIPFEIADRQVVPA